MALPRKIREQLNHWDKHGIPDDPGTIDVAARTVLPVLWADYIQLEAALDDLRTVLDERGLR